MNPTEKDAAMSVDSGDSKQREVAFGGLPLALRAARDRMRAFSAKPEIRVFSAPISKGAVLALGLACVAMLGKESQSRERGFAVSSETTGSATLPGEGPAPFASVASLAAPPAPPVASTPCASSNSATTEGAVAEGTSSDDSAVIDINTAGEKEFRTLPGVGPKKAAAILALREKLGKFRKVTDLLRVKGIGPKTLAKWRARLSVGETPPTKT